MSKQLGTVGGLGGSQRESIGQLPGLKLPWTKIDSRFPAFQSLVYGSPVNPVFNVTNRLQIFVQLDTVC